MVNQIPSLFGVPNASLDQKAGVLAKIAWRCMVAGRSVHPCRARDAWMSANDARMHCPPCAVAWLEAHSCRVDAATMLAHEASQTGSGNILAPQVMQGRMMHPASLPGLSHNRDAFYHQACADRTAMVHHRTGAKVLSG
jgi:hypothetical protein